MKIIICTSTFDTGLGGVSSYARDFVSAFNKWHEIVVVTGGKKVENPPCEIVFINDRNLNIENAMCLLGIINKEKPDIVVNSSFLLLSLITPFLPNNIRVITVSHFVNGYYARVAGYNASYIDKIIALSSQGALNISRRFKVKSPNKVKVVFNFMEHLQFVDYSKSKRSEVNIVFPGGTNRLKSADVFLKAILRLLKTNLPFRLYWIGEPGFPGQHWPCTHLKNLYQILPKDNRIVYVGKVSREESMKIFQDANIFVLPSRGEGFPISLIEAMRGRCIPIISDARHGAIDVINNGLNGYVARQGNYLDLFKCLEYVISHNNELESIYDKSYLTYKEKLDMDVWIGQMRSVFEEGMDHRERRKFSGIEYAKMVVSTKLYLFGYEILKRKIYDNIKAMIVYRIIYLKRNQY